MGWEQGNGNFGFILFVRSFLSLAHGAESSTLVVLVCIFSLKFTGWVGKSGWRRMLFVERIRAGYASQAIQQYARGPLRVSGEVNCPGIERNIHHHLHYPTPWIFLVVFSWFPSIHLNCTPRYIAGKGGPACSAIRSPSLSSSLGINERSREINEMKLWGTLLRWKFKFE